MGEKYSTEHITEVGEMRLTSRQNCWGLLFDFFISQSLDGTCLSVSYWMGLVYQSVIGWDRSPASEVTGERV